MQYSANGPFLKGRFEEKQLGHYALDPLFEIEFDRAAPGSRDAARTLYRQLKKAIEDGRLAVGTKLPASRRGAELFGVSRNTVAEIYDRLLNDGYVTARQGSGTYVAERKPPAPAAARASAFPLNPVWLAERTVAAMGFWRDSPGAEGGASIDFRPALIDSRLFPYPIYRRVSARQLRGLETKPPSYKSPQGNQGNFHLRQAITHHIALTRAVACRPEDVVVTSGAQQAFDLLARILVTPGETVVAVEDPGYPPLRAAFAAAGAVLVPVPVDGEGLVVEAVPAEARIVCVTPSHQFPLGATLSKPRRAALVELARRRGAVILEDDYDGEFRYEGTPLQSLRAADADDVVFYVGTFSKCMLPSLRLGFVVAPEWARRTLVAAKNCLDWHCSTPLQTGVAAFIAEGHLAHHVRRMRGLYRKRRQALIDILRRDFAGRLEPIPSVYGVHVAAYADQETDLEAVSARLARRGVKIHTLERYYLGEPGHKGLVFGYGAVDTEGIARGLAQLHGALTA